MRLSLNGWPPLASHLACILVGGSLTHLGQVREQPKDLAAAPSNKTILIFNIDEVELIDTQRGDSILVARRDSGKICLLSSSKVGILTNKSKIKVIGSAQSLPAIAAIAASASSKKLVLIGSENSKNYRLCEQEPKVTYGTP